MLVVIDGMRQRSPSLNGAPSNPIPAIPVTTAVPWSTRDNAPVLSVASKLPEFPSVSPVLSSTTFTAPPSVIAPVVSVTVSKSETGASVNSP